MSSHTFIFMLLVFVGLFISLGVGESTGTAFGFLFFVVWCGGLYILLNVLSKVDENSARENMKPTCSGTVFVSFYRDIPFTLFASSSVSDVFTFTNDDYARAFSSLNAGVKLWTK